MTDGPKKITKAGSENSDLVLNINGHNSLCRLAQALETASTHTLVVHYGSETPVTYTEFKSNADNKYIAIGALPKQGDITSVVLISDNTGDEINVKLGDVELFGSDVASANGTVTKDQDDMVADSYTGDAGDLIEYKNNTGSTATEFTLKITYRTLVQGVNQM